MRSKSSEMGRLRVRYGSTARSALPAARMVAHAPDARELTGTGNTALRPNPLLKAKMTA